MVHVLLATALLSIMLGALSGFAVLASVDYPAKLRALGVVNPMRVLPGASIRLDQEEPQAFAQ
ncbi:hypothetical protein [Pseudomonas protegens]|uniref:hypothetical protein n=1 Tax=Pseudomonas protegens TaxID=380021 RepID=UPI001B33A1AD|nr:hypothetical protein [Pseudomonas protegens]MBP5127182.1 hypothetical protein [Pseudomonas protegens]